MAIGSFNGRGQQTPMADMNVVPLVDVMLVLLVIFIVTAPLLTHSVRIDLPKASSSANITKPEHIEFGIREDGDLFWNGEKLALAELGPRFSRGGATAAATRTAYPRRPQCALRERGPGHERGGESRPDADRFCHRSGVGIVMRASPLRTPRMTGSSRERDSRSAAAREQASREKRKVALDRYQARM
jgi:biopolymer transport protein ExbD